MRIAPLAPIAFAALFATSTYAADDGEIEQGKKLAERWCVSCHVVGPETAGGDAGPSLVSVANRPDMRPRDILVWLLAPHPPMPDLSLTQREARVLTRYIQSLREE